MVRRVRRAMGSGAISQLMFLGTAHSTFTGEEADIVFLEHNAFVFYGFLVRHFYERLPPTSAVRVASETSQAVAVSSQHASKGFHSVFVVSFRPPGRQVNR